MRVIQNGSCVLLCEGQCSMRVAFCYAKASAACAPVAVVVGVAMRGWGGLRDLFYLFIFLSFFSSRPLALIFSPNTLAGVLGAHQQNAGGCGGFFFWRLVHSSTGFAIALNGEVCICVRHACWDMGTNTVMLHATALIHLAIGDFFCQARFKYALRMTHHTTHVIYQLKQTGGSKSKSSPRWISVFIKMS